MSPIREKTVMVVLQRGNGVVASRYTPRKSADWQPCLCNIKVGTVRHIEDWLKSAI